MQNFLRKLVLAALLFTGAEKDLARVINLQVVSGVTGNAAVEVREGSLGNDFRDKKTDLQATASGSASAAAGPAAAQASATASTSATFQGSELTQLGLSGVSTVTSRADPTDPEEDGAGGFAFAEAHVVFQVTEVTTAFVHVEGSESRFDVVGNGVTLAIGSLPASAGNREIVLLPGINYSFRLNADAVASFAQGFPSFNSSASISVDFGPGTNRFQWVNPAGGSYFDTNNWSPAHVPTKNAAEADLAFFNLPVQYIVDSTGSSPAPLHAANTRTATADRWVITAGEVRNVGGAILSSTSPEQPSLSLGNGGRLNLQSGALKTFHSRIGDLPGNRSDVWVMGEGTRWENNGFLFLGDYGPGQLLVFDGFLSASETRIGGSSGGTGEAFIRGSHAEWDSGNMAVGYGDAAGSIDLQDGGTLKVDQMFVGYGNGGRGRVTITGGGTNGFPSLLIASNKVDVGYHSPGELSLSAGGWAQSTENFNISVTDTTGAGAGTVRVSGVSSDNRASYLFFGALNIGGGGRLEVTDGGLAEFHDVSFVGLPGRADVSVGGVHAASGKRSTLAFDDLTALAYSQNGSSSLVISNGALVHVKGEFQIGVLDDGFVSVHSNQGGHSAELQVDGPLKLFHGQIIITDDGLVRSKSSIIGAVEDAESQVDIDADRSFPAWIVDGNLQVGGAGKGTIIFLNDGVVSVSQNVFVAPAKGMICGNGIVRTPDLTNAGSLCPGNSPGTLTIDGNLTQVDSGRLIIEIAGTGPGEYDVLNVTGTAKIGGTIEYRLIDFFHPQVGNNVQPLRIAAGSTLAANHVIGGQPLGFASVAGEFANGQFQITSLKETNYNILHAFGPTNNEAINPWGRLTLASDGYLYGCARNSGPSGGGSIFRIHPDGYDYAVLHNFDPDTEGAQPLGGVIEASNGLLYGTASIGGTNNSGTIWSIAKNGTSFSVLHHFASTADIRTPSAELLESSDGILYGTGSAGGGFTRGGVFQMNLDGSKYFLVTGFGGGLGDEPSGPVGGLVEGPNHAFYGTTENGGSANKGAVFRLERNGLFTTIKSLGLAKGGAENPNSTLVLDKNGALFGTTYSGGTSNFGTIFTVKTDGSGFAVIKNFGATAVDAREPRVGLIETFNGQLAGTTRIGGQNGQGALFLVGKDGTGYRILHSFTGANSDGARSRAPLIQPVAGVFYGSTFGGGAGDNGTLFRFFAQDLIPSPLLAETPQNIIAAPGESITLRATSTNVLPAFYQWQHAGTNIPGARGPTLTLSTLAATNVGSYMVTVRNLSGHSTNSQAQLALFGINNNRNLTISGQPGSRFRIESTDSLSATSNWITLTNRTLTGSTAEIADPSPASWHRFYRAALVQ